jgi:tetratricopeptide (TPR) repeat protein
MRPARNIWQSTCVSAAVAVIAMAALLGLAGCGGAQSRYQGHMERGKQYLATGNLDKANIEFRNASQILPKDSDAFYFNGVVAERRGEIRQAVGFYQAAIDKKPGNELARARLAKVLVLGGATQKALEVVGPGLLDAPDDADLLAARSAALHELKDDVAARADAERAVKLAPTNENAIAVLAALAVQSHDVPRAISIVSAAVSQAPESVDLRRVLASIYVSSGQSAEAQEQMRKIIALEPNELTPRVQLARHFSDIHEPAEAQRVLEQAVKDLPHRDQAKLALVDFITTQRSRGEGEQILRDFIAQEPGNDGLRLQLGTLLERAGATQEALAAYQDIVKHADRGSMGLAARDRIAAIEISRGHADRAKKLVAEVLDASPRDDDALIMSADIALQQNDPTSAISDLRAVLGDRPKSVVLNRTLARAYLAKNERGLAEEALRAAVDAAPAQTSIKIELAQFLIQTGHTSQAVRLLEETVQHAPGDQPAREALVRAYIANYDLPAARTAAADLEKLQPQSAAGYYLSGLVAHDQGRLDDAAQDMERALVLQPGSLEILTSLTRLALERGHGAAAVARLKHALDGDPKNVQLLDMLGEVYVQTKDLAGADETLTRALALEPRSWLSYRGLAQVRLAANDPDGAIEQYLNGLKVAPAQSRLLAELAGLYEKQGRVDEAIARYDALSRSDPSVRQIAANNIAMLLITKADKASLDRAHDLTEDFTESDNAIFLDTRGWVQFKRRDYRDAIVVLERAAIRSPESPVIRYHLGMAQLQSGQRDLARANLEAALSGAGDFTGSQEARSALASLRTARPG